MKKTRFIIRAITFTLSVVSVVGIIILILDDKSAQYTFYEIIAFCIGVAAMSMAILEQVNTRRLERHIENMSHELHKLIQEETNEEKDEKYIKRKIAELVKSKK